MITAAYVLAISFLVTDAQGRHPIVPKGQRAPISDAAAEAIAPWCNAHPMHDVAIPGDELCAAVHVFHTFRESGWDLHAVGDGGHSFGPYQVYEMSPPRTWKEAVEQWSRLFRRAQVCLEMEGGEPLEMLATGKCGTTIGRQISRVRMTAARRIVLEQRFYDYPGR